MPLLTTLAPLLFILGADDPARVTLKGEVISLVDALRARRIEADAGPIEGQVVVVTKSGEIVPLVSDDASRALFLDKRLRGRPVEIVARRYPGVPLVLVLTFQVEEGGALRTPEYYCEICAIGVRYPQICPCCQGPMVLQMKPEGR